MYAALTAPSAPPHPVTLYSKLDLLKMSTDADRLMRMAGQIVSIWNIPLDEQAEPDMSPFSTLLSHPSPTGAALDDEEEDETQFLTVAPGVWAPQVSQSSNRLTWRGKEQVLWLMKRAHVLLRKSSLRHVEHRLSGDFDRVQN
jgi:hypothetical protein